MRHLSGLLVGATALLGACATTGDEPQETAGSASADINGAGGGIVARAEASQGGSGIRVRIEAARLPPGTYGAHVHAVGRCDPPGFESAGPHWNPTQRQHGAQNPQGPHSGDLPNLAVGTNRDGSLEFTIAGASLREGARALLDADGAAVVIHANPDDYSTDPSGNSGTRIACGVLG